MRSYVHFDADYGLVDWKTAMADKPIGTWRSIIAQLPADIHGDEKKRLLALRLMVQGLAEQQDGLLYCMSGGGIVLLFEGRASTWVETFSRVLMGISDDLAQSMQLFDLSTEYRRWDALTARMIPTATNLKTTADGKAAPIQLSAEKLQEIKKIRAHRQKPQVLLVEDDPFTRGLVSTLIQNSCDLISAGNLRQALSLYRQKLPDLVFLDIELPDGKGIDALKTITDADSEAFVVMLSSHTEKANIVQCLENGAKGFVAKPFTRDRIMHHIQLAGERKRVDGTLHTA